MASRAFGVLDRVIRYIDLLLEARDAAGQQHEQQHTQCMYTGLRSEVSEPEKISIICVSAKTLAKELIG
jgi:hypothetical protein